jgi:hypothetical protein
MQPMSCCRWIRTPAAGFLAGALVCMVVVSCSGGSDREPNMVREQPSVGEAASPQQEPAARPLTGRRLQHGGVYWAVYFAVSRYGDPDVERVARALERQGFTPSTLDISCDRGAAEALGIPNENRAVVALYFDTEQEAQEFAHSADPDPVGYARVRTHCLD